MSRRTLGFFLALAAGAAAAVYVIAGRGGSSTPTAAAPPSSMKTERPSVAASRPGPQLEPGTPATGSTGSAEAPTLLEPHVAPEMAARAVRIAGNRTVPPTGTATVHTNPTMPDLDVITAQRARALEVLAEKPGDVDATRVLVTAACAGKDLKTARKYSTDLPPGDRADMARTCSAYGITLEPAPTWKAPTRNPAPAPIKQRSPK